MSSTTDIEVLVADDSVEQREIMAVARFLTGYCGSTRVSFTAISGTSPAGATKPN
jgi:hypothetical protein